MKTFKFSLVLRTRENTDVFISLDDNIYGIHSKRINILYVLLTKSYMDSGRPAHLGRLICVFVGNGVLWLGCFKLFKSLKD